MKTIELFSPSYPDFTNEYISQGLLGDCWLISAILTLTFNESGKDLLKKIFFIKDGMYKIKLYNEINIPKYVNIKPKFYIEEDNNTIELKYAGYGKNIPHLFQQNPHTELIWVPIIEKALIKYVGSYQKLNGNTSFTAYKMLTGLEPKFVHGFGINKRFIDKFTDLFNKGKICCTLETNINLNNNDIIDNHAYSLYKIIGGNWYLHNPHNNFKELENCVTISQNRINTYINLLTYIVIP